MHELSIITNLITFLEKLCKKEKAKRVIGLNININPLSCLDQDNLNFMFSSMVKGKKYLENAKINVKRGDDPLTREVIIENVEIEVENGN